MRDINYDKIFGTETVEVTGKSVKFTAGESGKNKIMSKTVSVDDDGTRKVDNLNETDEMEKDVEKQKQTAGMVLMPLFRFEEKEKPGLISFCVNTVQVARDIRKKPEYMVLLDYLNILPEKDVEHMINLTIERNKDNTSVAQEPLKVHVVTLFFEKKLRLELNIKEDDFITKEKFPEYFEKKDILFEAFKKFCNEIYIHNKPKGTEAKYIHCNVIKGSGDADYGYGFVFEIIYDRKLDYFTARRSREMYEGIVIEDENLFNEQNNINTITNSHSSEGISDGMDDDSDGEGEDMGVDDEGGDDDGFGGDDEEGDGDDDMGFGGDDEDDMGGDGDDNSDDGDGFGGDDDGGGSKDDGANPLREINGRQKLNEKYKELVSEIDSALKIFNSLPLAENVVVKKIVDLRIIVLDAVKLTYSQPSEESLLRYEMYVAEFRHLVNSLKSILANKKSSNKE